MKSKQSEVYWKNLSLKITDPTQTKNKRPDTSDLEIDFLQNYTTEQDNVLDIGSGSGLIVNKLIPKVKSIIAVEKFEGFSKFIVQDDNLLVINADLLEFKIRKEFEIVLCFGVSQCFSLEDMTAIYKNCFEMTKSGGYFIVRMQCGIEKGKTVNGYSEELKTDYFADYRYWKDEINLLKETGFTEIERFDIFPDTLNVWPDTRHYIFVCKK